MAHGARKAVVTALIANTILTVLKFIAAMFSSSASMMNEAIHSLMDSLNQAFLLVGLNVAKRPADEVYAFGHGQKKYLWNLWSAIGLFSIGCGLGLAHAWHSWQGMAHVKPQTAIEILGFSVAPVWFAGIVLLIALILDGYSLAVALHEFRLRMQQAGDSNIIPALIRSDDPTLVAVVLEDSVATLGVLFAMTGIALSTYTGNPLWDIVFSTMIAVLLGLTAFFLGSVNMRFLADVRDQVAEAAFVRVVEAHPEVERYHDLRSIIIDDGYTVLVAEVELREEAIVAGMQGAIEGYQREYMATLSSDRRNDVKVQRYCRNRAAAQATLEKTETVIEELAAAIMLEAPQVHHVTIEVEGIAASPLTD